MVEFNNAKKIFKTYQIYTKNAATVTETATATPAFGNEDQPICMCLNRSLKS